MRTCLHTLEVILQVAPQAMRDCTLPTLWIGAEIGTPEDFRQVIDFA
jgi:hypothetical protein